MRKGWKFRVNPKWCGPSLLGKRSSRGRSRADEWMGMGSPQRPEQLEVAHGYAIWDEVGLPWGNVALVSFQGLWRLNVILHQVIHMDKFNQAPGIPLQKLEQAFLNVAHYPGKVPLFSKPINASWPQSTSSQDNITSFQRCTTGLQHLLLCISLRVS